MSGISAETQPTWLNPHIASASQMPFAAGSMTTLFSTFLFLKMWEKAIKLSKELAETYESKVFDYEGLGHLLVSLGRVCHTSNRHAKVSVHEHFL